MRDALVDVSRRFRPQLARTGSSGLSDLSGGFGTSLGFACGAAASAVLVGALLAHSTYAGAALAVAALIFGVMAADVVRLAVVAVVGVWITKRAPGLNVSYSDILVAVTGALAFFAGVGHTLGRHGRAFLKAFAFYLLTLTATLAVNHNIHAYFEWFHRIALVAGSVLVGAWLVRARKHHIALRLLLAWTVVVSILAMVHAAQSGFHPAQPLGYQKNFIGSLAASLLLVMIAAHEHFRLSRRLLRAAGVVVLGGLLASQSRGAMVAFAVGCLIWWFRESSHKSPRLRRAAVLAAIVLAVFAALSVQSELNSHKQHTSITYRFQVEHATHKLWEQHPLFGVGLRFWYFPQYVGYAPPNNVIDEVLAEAGVIGLLGFIVFVFGSLTNLGRIKGDLATAGLAVVAGRFAHGLFDIYWVGGTTTLVWLIAGMGIASSSELTTGHGEPLQPATQL